MLALLDESYSGALQISRWLIGPNNHDRLRFYSALYLYLLNTYSRLIVGCKKWDLTDFRLSRRLSSQLSMSPPAGTALGGGRPAAIRY